VACAFHSPVVAGAQRAFAAVLAGHDVSGPAERSGPTARPRPYPADPAGVRAELAAQIGAPVRFVDQIEAMYAAGARVFVEAGPGPVLTGLVGPSSATARTWPVACDGRPATGLRDLLPGALASPERVNQTDHTDHTGDGGHADRDALISEYLRTSREMIAAQRDVLLTYFGGAPGERPTAPPPAATAPLPVATPATAPPAPAAHALATPEPATPEPAAPATGPDVLRAVSEIISERTGYPVDMIEPDLDLEADLSIDSIKRAEIAGELARRLGVAGAGTAALGDEELEELAKARTTAAVTDWLTARLTPTSHTPAHTPAPATDTPDEPAAEPAAAPGVAPQRMLLVPVPLTLLDEADEADEADRPDRAGPPDRLTGKRFALLGGDAGGVAEAVAARLAGHGARAVTLDAGHLLAEDDGPVDGVLLLDPLTGSGAPLLPGVFAVLQAALRRAPRRLLAVRADDPLDPRPAGLRGVFRTVAREYPDTAATLVELAADAPASAADVADALLDELSAPDRTPVVLRTADGRRHRLDLTRGAPGPRETARRGRRDRPGPRLRGGPGRRGAWHHRPVRRRPRVRRPLPDRTARPYPGRRPGGSGHRRSQDETALRAALAARGGATPAEIERETARILAAARGRRDPGGAERTRAAGCGTTRWTSGTTPRCSGRQADPRRARPARRCRLRGRVIEDKLIADKDRSRSAGLRHQGRTARGRCWTRSRNCRNGPGVRRAVRQHRRRLGNRGQSDYAAANDALETIGARGGRTGPGA
jgi:acyl transferase domain-containing protein